jgi:hypothetical protein
MQAEDRNGVDVVLPKQMPHAPFDWQHANLDPFGKCFLMHSARDCSPPSWACLSKENISSVKSILQSHSTD